MKNYDNMLSRFHRISERHRRTDEWTDRQICYINIVSLVMCDKNRFLVLFACSIEVNEHRSMQFSLSHSGDAPIINYEVPD